MIMLNIVRFILIGLIIISGWISWQTEETMSSAMFTFIAATVLFYFSYLL